jgi:hypothetical protein
MNEKDGTPAPRQETYRANYYEDRTTPSRWHKWNNECGDPVSAGREAVGAKMDARQGRDWRAPPRLDSRQLSLATQGAQINNRIFY